jgi:hypothetical protein
MLADSPEGSSPTHAPGPVPVLAPVPVSLPTLLPLALDTEPIPVFVKATVVEQPPQRTSAPPAAVQAPEPLYTPVAAPAAPQPAPVFKPPPPSDTNASVPAPLRTGTASNTTRRRTSKRKSGDAGLDRDSDAHPNANLNPSIDEETRDTRAPEKENTIRRRLRGPAAATKGKKTALASATSSGIGPVRKVTTRLVVAEPTVEPGRVGGAASRLLAAASAAAGRGDTATSGSRRDS